MYMWHSQVVVSLHVLIGLLCSKHSGMHGAYVKGGACMHWVNSLHIYTACMSPALSENYALESIANAVIRWKYTN